MQGQLNLFNEKVTLISVVPEENRYRAYQVEWQKGKPAKLLTRWGRLKRQKKTWILRHKRWLGEKQEEFDSQDKAEKAFARVIKQKNRRGYMQFCPITALVGS